MTALGPGFLTGTITDAGPFGPGDLRRNMPRLQTGNIGNNLALVERLKSLAASERVSPAQLALAWVLSRRPFVMPILGTRQLAQREYRRRRVVPGARHAIRAGRHLRGRCRRGPGLQRRGAATRTPQVR